MELLRLLVCQRGCLDHQIALAIARFEVRSRLARIVEIEEVHADAGASDQRAHLGQDRSHDFLGLQRREDRAVDLVDGLQRVELLTQTGSHHIERFRQVFKLIAARHQHTAGEVLPGDPVCALPQLFELDQMLSDLRKAEQQDHRHRHDDDKGKHRFEVGGRRQRLGSRFAQHDRPLADEEGGSQKERPVARQVPLAAIVPLEPARGGSPRSVRDTLMQSRGRLRRRDQEVTGLPHYGKLGRGRQRVLAPQGCRADLSDQDSFRPALRDPPAGV